MIQFIPAKCYGGEIGQVQSDPLLVPCYTPLRGAAWGSNGTADYFRYSSPWSVAGNFKHLYVEIMWADELPTGGGWPDIDFELYINNVASGLKVTVPGHAASIPPPGYISVATDIFHTAAVLPGDRVALVRGAGQIPPSFNQFTAWIAWSVAFESTNTGESGYATSSWGQGLINATNILVAAPFTGAGGFQLESLNTADIQSVVPLEGSLFRIDVELSVAPGPGASRVYAAYLNGVLQDGSGLTVDTRVTISGTNTKGNSTFTLPIHVLDLLTIAQLVSVGTAPAASLVTFSVGVKATTDGQSALGFFSNGFPDNTSAYPQDYSSGFGGGFSDTTARAPIPWSTSKPNRYPVSEYTMSLPGPIDGFSLDKLCVDLTSAPTTGNGWTFTTRKNLADTPGNVVVSDSNILAVGTISAGTFTSPSDRIDLKATVINTPHSTQLEWTWLVVAAPVPEGGIYKIVPEKRNDTLYNIGDVKIPDPSWKTGLIGG